MHLEVNQADKNEDEKVNESIVAAQFQIILLVSQKEEKQQMPEIFGSKSQRTRKTTKMSLRRQ
jgi:hypothetical protein